VGLVLVGEDPGSLGGEYGYAYAATLNETLDEPSGARASRGAGARRDVEPA
jgi:hypothetical protein